MSLITPVDVSPTRAWALLGTMSRGLPVIMTPDERRGLFLYGYITHEGALTTEGRIWSTRSDAEVRAAQRRWDETLGAAS